MAKFHHLPLFVRVCGSKRQNGSGRTQFRGQSEKSTAPSSCTTQEKMTKDLYIGTLDPENGTGACMANLLYQALEEYNSLMKIKILSSDSTPKISGPLGGTAAILEEKIGRALQRIYCILHTIDLIGKGFFTMIDGGTSGPGERAGPLGKKLTKTRCTSLQLWTLSQFQPWSKT